jgi:predicted nucleotidyltransferase
MNKDRVRKHTAANPRRYRAPDIPLRAIRRYARQVAERFQPDKIVLFGSYAYGRPHQGSDVDLLVIMPAANEINQAIRICVAVEPPFSLDLIVRTPAHLERDLKDGDWFVTEIMEKGKVLYEKKDGTVGAQGRDRLAHGKKPRAPETAGP